MGQVIAIKEATRVVAGDPALTFIDECYSRLAALPGFIVRPGQRDLSYAICKALVAGEPIAAEAPTGTGKTIAYLLGAIAAGEKLQNVKEIPIVVATATVGLQSQILMGDLPRLVQAGIIGENDSVLAKGRGRYFCVMAAERLTEGKEASAQVDFFDEEGNRDSESLDELREMLENWHGHSWTGDVDSYTGTPPMEWPKVAASSETCVGHKCEHYNSCPFFNARRALSAAKIIVANHDLVLSDLAMAKDGQDPLFPGGKYLVIFDEAHHLPDKALDAGSAELELATIEQELPKMAGFNKAWQRQGDLARLFDKQKLYAIDFDPNGLMSSLTAVKSILMTFEVDEATGQHRFEKGALPDELRKALDLALVQCELLRTAMQDAGQALKQTNLPEKNEALKPVVAELLFQAAGINALLGKVHKALTLMTSDERAVRWMFRKEESTSLHTSPLEGAAVLRDLLWNSERAVVGMVSATLQDFDGFDRFKDRSGAPDSLRTCALPHIFPYRENSLYLVEMRNSPRQEEKEGFHQELLDHLPKFIDPAEGTLVLFPSRMLMRHVLPALKARFGRQILVQGDMGIKELVRTHKERVDAGQGSILCGLATLAEGLDLPGAYCTHVVIVALPFTVPISPVEQELQEELGREYFAKRALPDALVKLVQMVGRLMRRETDRGRITVFDKRLLYTKWGLKMLGALPAFKRRRVLPHDPPARA